MPALREPRSPRLRLAKELPDPDDPNEPRVSVPPKTLVSCLQAVGGNQHTADTEASRLITHRLASLFDERKTQPIEPQVAFGCLKNFSDSKEIHALCKELVKAAWNYIQQAAKGTLG